MTNWPLIIGCIIGGTLLCGIYFFVGIYSKTKSYKKYVEKKVNEYKEFYTHGEEQRIRASTDRYVIINGAVRKNGQLYMGNYIFDKSIKGFTCIEQSILFNSKKINALAERLNYEDKVYKTQLKSFING